ncbi:hypothetical protein E1212_14100 [Jiangella ureilytica]|uniref:WD40 repeat domain-containing protein n=1 Tax=Jiangella ureilytica TaxID=2530374 RepID=A0A4R4RLU4_9ACTN|nr:hypothetical protein [Jiangella ureilytica]TDC50691.1 hypothetical protein E1212_14100 [Jiangella ureilytica]
MPRWIPALLVAVLMTTATAGAAAPAASVAPAAIGTVEDLGVPISNFLILDSVTGVDRDGRPMLYGSTYAASSPGVTFFAIDIETGELVKELPMPDSWGGYHTSLGSDGRVYLATQHGDGLAHLWRYDPRTEQLGIVATSDETDIGHTFFFGVGAGRAGKTYLGTYPSGKLFSFDQRTAELRDLGVVQQDRLYAKAIVPLDGRRVFVGGGTPASANIVDTRTGVATSILPAQYADYSFAYNAAVVGNDLLVQMVVPDQRVLRFGLRGTRTEFLGEVPALTGTGVLPISDDEAYAVGTCPGASYGIVRYSFGDDGCTRLTDASWVSGQLSSAVIDGSEWLVGIGQKGLFGRFNPATGEVVTAQLLFTGSGSNVTALRTGPDGAVYGGTYETNALFRIDPSTGATTVLGGVAVGRSGEILSLASTDDELFMGSYTHNVVTVYDPARPWQPGADPASNPVDLGPVGDEQYRPWDMVQGSSGDVYVASGAAYGQLGGALSRVDGDTHAVSSWRHLAGDHNLFSLAAGAGEIYVGSTTHGDGVTATGDARLLVFDEASAAVVHSVVPVPGSEWIASLAVAGNGAVYGSTLEGDWFRFDPASRTVTALGSFPLGSALALATGPDGLVYGTSGSALFRIDPATDTVTTLAEVGGGYYRTIAFDDSGRVYWGSGSHVMRWTP